MIEGVMSVLQNIGIDIIDVVRRDIDVRG